MKTILAAIDFSDVTDAVVEAALQQATLSRAFVHVVHAAVLEPAFVGYGVSPVQDFAFQKKTMDEEQKKLDAIVEKLRENGVDAAAQLREGPVVDALFDAVEENKVDLIVVGSHGHGALFNLVAGSVTQAILHKTKVPVLVVPSRAV